MTFSREKRDELLQFYPSTRQPAPVKAHKSRQIVANRLAVVGVRYMLREDEHDILWSSEPLAAS